MKRRWQLSVVLVVSILVSGCASLLPTSKALVNSPWQDYNSALADYDRIIPSYTTVEDLKIIGFDPHKVPNIRILNATDTINIFMSNPSLRIEDLDPGVQRCAATKSRCTSYRIEPSLLDSKRVGNVLLDLLTFKRHTIATGWEFRGLIIIVDDVVVYKEPAGGRPSINTEEEQVKPLGPLQDPVSILPATRIF
ncbi:MAG: hypothetical protein ACYC7J_07325 [Syntrophales bacterium]